jgi:TatD DNase family protein
VYPNQPHLKTEDITGLVDTHCHLDVEPLASHLAEVLESARRAGVTRFVVPGVHPGDWERIRSLASRQKGIFPAFGIHPMHAGLVDDIVLARLEEFAPMGIAIGEIGLDPTYPVSLERQEQAFRKQLRLAVSLGLPVLVHCRRAFQRTLQIIREEKAAHVRGIMHAFSGSPEMAREFIRLGFLISISGTVTWSNAVRPVKLARELPLESLALETDAPDLTPQAYRGQSNQPVYLAEVLRAVAQVRGISPDDVAIQTTKNTTRLLSFP